MVGFVTFTLLSYILPLVSCSSKEFCTKNSSVKNSLIQYYGICFLILFLGGVTF